jgi:DNA-binding response OmpR family regulator
MTAKVLVVDDERVIADTLVLILERQGFDAIAVYDGESAVDTADAFRPDALISDVIMPRMNGIDAAIEISEIIPFCQILLLSGRAETEDLMSRARSAGYDFELLAKPLPPTEILEWLETHAKENPSAISPRGPRT